MTRNAAREQHRRRAARDRREQAAATPEALPSAAAIAEREELRRQVVQAVLELEEPYRSTVLWRYFEELPPKAIAARTGTPPATVRTHLHRALAHLRARLDGLHAGDRRRWALALVPLAAMGGGAEAATLGVGAGVWVAASAAVATLGASLWWWQPWSAGSRSGVAPLDTARVATERARPAEPTPAPLPVAPPEVEPSPTSAAPPAPAPAPLPAQAIAGRVVTDGGEAVTEIRLGWQPRRLFEGSRRGGWPQQHGRDVAVDGDGRWVVEQPGRGDIALTLRGPSRWRLCEPIGARFAAPGERDVRVVVEALPRLRFRVLDAVTGLPAQGAAAEGLASEPVDDGIEVWLPSDATYVRVTAPGYRPNNFEVATPTGPEAVHPEPVRLVPDVELTGKLTDDEGRPMEQAVVFVTPIDGRPLADDVELVAVTATNGRYQVGGLRTGRFRLIARAMGRAAAIAELDLTGPTTTRDLVLAPGDDGPGDPSACQAWSTRSSMLVNVAFDDVPALPALRWLAAAAGTCIDERELEPADRAPMRVSIELGGLALRDMAGLICETCALRFDPATGAFLARRSGD